MTIANVLQQPKKLENVGHPRKVFESRGQDSDRVNKLINLPTCSCA